MRFIPGFVRLFVFTAMYYSWFEYTIIHLSMLLLMDITGLFTMNNTAIHSFSNVFDTWLSSLVWSSPNTWPLWSPSQSLRRRHATGSFLDCSSEVHGLRKPYIQDLLQPGKLCPDLRFQQAPGGSCPIITLAEDVQAGKRQRRCFSEGQVICGWKAGRIWQFGRHEAWDKGMIGDCSFCFSNTCIKWASGKTKQKTKNCLMTSHFAYRDFLLSP